jgi:ketosteroid isomerase-like protein
MTNTILISLLIAGALSQGLSQTEQEDIEAAIRIFAKAADKRDVKVLDKILHAEFRLAMNQLFGSQDLTTMNKATYLKMVEEGKLGGEDRKLEILEVKVFQKNASCIVRFTGSKMSFQTFLQLVKGADGNWTVVNDLPALL